MESGPLSAGLSSLPGGRPGQGGTLEAYVNVSRL